MATTGRPKGSKTKKLPQLRPLSDQIVVMSPRDFSRRVQNLWANHSVDEIENFARDKRACGKLSGIDAAIIARIRLAQTESGIADMQILLERLIGKVPQVVAGDPDAPLIASLDVNEIARRTAFILAAATNQPVASKGERPEVLQHARLPHQPPHDKTLVASLNETSEKEAEGINRG